MNIKKESLLLESEDIYLRTLSAQDITDEYINGLNDPEVNRYLVNVRRQPQTKETVGEFVNVNAAAPSSVLFGVFVKNEKDSFIGTIRVSDIDFFHYTGIIGICLFAKRAWKKGFALQAVQLVKDYLFKTVGLHYVEAGVNSKNTNSIKLFIGAGFREWYRIRDKFRHDDHFEEAIFFATINPSFDMSRLKQRLQKDQHE